MHDIFIKALYERVKAGQITIEQLPDIIKPQIMALQNESQQEEVEQ